MITRGSFKCVFTILVLVILLLMLYSYYHQSTLLTPITLENNNVTANHVTLTINGKLPVGLRYAQHTDSMGTSRQEPIELWKNVNTEQISEQSTFTHTSLNSTLRGHIIALNVYEQQTMASGNLLQLQCWAKYLNMMVVKPFMHDSNLVTPLDETKQFHMLRMEDTFDMHDWTQYSELAGYSPLVDWAEFITSGPRKLIVVQTKYPVLTYVKEIRSKGLPFPHPPSQEKQYAQGCKFKFLHSKGLSYLQSKGFVVVRSVCLNFRSGDELTMEQIQDHIFGEYLREKERVSLIIDEWRGLGENQRFLVQEKICPEKGTYKEHTKPSVRILHDAELYTQKYLSQSEKNTSYVAVMARFEMTGLTKHISSEGDKHAIIPKCLQQTLKGLKVVKTTRHIAQTFLSIDIGKYGSDSFRNKKYFGHLSDMEKFVERVQGLQVREWEKTFEDITHSQDSGYIAMLQLVLVTRAECVVFVGGGTFQRHALHLYQQLHPNETERCVRVIDKCTSPYRPVAR